MKNLGMVAAAALLATGCSPMKTLTTAGAVVFAPITALIMTVEARRNDRWSLVKRARKNDAPPPVIDAHSAEQARGALEQALEIDIVGREFYWENPEDAEVGAVGGLAMVVPVEEAADAPNRREVYIAIYLDRHTDHRVVAYCRDGDAWRECTEGMPET